MKRRRHFQWIEVLAKTGTFSLVVTLCALAVVSPPPGATAKEGENYTAEVIPGKPVGAQRFTAPAEAKPVKLDRSGAYTVVDTAEEKRKQELATPASVSSRLLVTEESFALHDKEDGTVIYPLTAWRFEPGGGGFQTSERPDHRGIDLPIETGTKIYSIADGEVTKASFEEGGYGNYVVISHMIGGTEVETRYGHMVEPSELKEGDKVDRGDVIGFVGSTGRSTGPHLHFEVRIEGEPQDPASWLELNAVR